MKGKPARVVTFLKRYYEGFIQLCGGVVCSTLSHVLQFMTAVTDVFRMAQSRPFLRERIDERMPQLTAGPMSPGSTCVGLNHSDLMSHTVWDMSDVTDGNYPTDSRVIRYVF
jgi:hypothetical protein